MKNVTVLDSLVDCFRRHSPEAGHDFWTWIGLFLLSLYSNSHRNAAPKPRILSESCFVTDFCFCFLIVLSLSSLATIRPSMIVSFYHRRLHPSSDQPSFCSCLSVSRLWPSPLSGSLATLLSCRTDLNHTLSSVLLPSFFVAWQGRCTKGSKCRESLGINDTFDGVASKPNESTWLNGRLVLSRGEEGGKNPRDLLSSCSASSRQSSVDSPTSEEVRIGNVGTEKGELLCYAMNLSDW